MSRHNIQHTTDIDAPIDLVWKHLIDIDHWSWNKWTKLETKDEAHPGVKGTLKASFEGNDIWETYDFEFGAVDNRQHLLLWQGKVGPNGCLFSGCHSMQLEAVSPNRTRLIHQEHFGGLLPQMGLGLPYKKLDRNYRLMNEAFKEYVEAK